MMPVAAGANATTPGTSPALGAARSMASMWENVPAADGAGAWARDGWARAVAAWPTPTAPMAATFAVAFTISRRLGRWIMGSALPPRLDRFIPRRRIPDARAAQRAS